MEGPPLGALHCLPSHQLLLYAVKNNGWGAKPCIRHYWQWYIDVRTRNPGIWWPDVLKTVARTRIRPFFRPHKEKTVARTRIRQFFRPHMEKTVARTRKRGVWCQGWIVSVVVQRVFRRGWNLGGGDWRRHSWVNHNLHRFSLAVAFRFYFGLCVFIFPPPKVSPKLFFSKLVLFFLFL